MAARNAARVLRRLNHGVPTSPVVRKARTLLCAEDAGPRETAQSLVAVTECRLRAGLAAPLAPLISDELIEIEQIAGAGRGFVAATAIPLGTKIHEERPFACHLALGNSNKVCHHCLAVLGINQQPTISIGQRLRFCSATCLEQAEETYLEAEVEGAFRELETHCTSTEQRFPLLVKRVACSALTAGNRQAAAASEALDFLCFAKIGAPPPAEWVETHRLFCSGLRAYLGLRPDLEPVALQRQLLELSWFCDTLARLHLNTFRVDCVFPPEPGRGFRDMAATAIGGGGESSFSGSAVYLAASLFNHSCCPNVDLNFPNNDGKAVFTAARPIDAGEELCISYLDATLPREARQQQLHWGYGFRCRCTRCVEQEEPPGSRREAAPTSP